VKYGKREMSEKHISESMTKDQGSEKNSDQKDKEKKKNREGQIQGTHCEKESLLMMFKRWKKIEEDFYVGKDENNIFDLSKLPEICDNIVYDMIHYPELREDKQRERLLRLAQMLCMVNVPCEYGITNA